MEAIYSWLNSLVNKNKGEFAKWSSINWLNPYSASDYEAQRTVLLEKLDNSVLFNATKPYHQQISKGCSICGAGQWSCLFITNKCNAACFYCPVPQNDDERPSTQGLDFNNAMEYAAYIKHFDFKGVSFSGGEPLLFYQRTNDYLKAVRKHCNDDIYIWMYTNGLLADARKMAELANNGLNEIRFDIGATNFSLDKVKLAKGIIPNVTIEIPAVPEEKEQLIAMLPAMKEAGVTNLNLHQMRLTQHNAPKLLKRGYTIINAERPLVLESELAALEILNAARSQGLEIGINYCSFHYKHRFQKAGYRQMLARELYPPEMITSAGYVREFSGNTIAYKLVKIVPDTSSNKEAKSTTIDNKLWSYEEYYILKEENLSLALQHKIEALLAVEPTEPPADSLLFRIWQLEYIESGLRAYF